MIDLAIQVVTAMVTLALPFILMGYVRYLTRRAEQAASKASTPNQ